MPRFDRGDAMQLDGVVHGMLKHATDMSGLLYFSAHLEGARVVESKVGKAPTSSPEALTAGRYLSRYLAERWAEAPAEVVRKFVEV
jgi:hypothetical protein